MNDQNSKKTASWIGGFIVIGVGVGCSIGAMFGRLEVGLGWGIAIGLIAGVAADQIRKHTGR